jgi:hypothetical protein
MEKKNIASVLLSGKDLMPILTSDEKYPDNGTGLCNQLFAIINTISTIDFRQDSLYVDLFSKDVHTGDLVKISEILDLEQMRITNAWDINDIHDLRGGLVRIDKQGYVFMAYHMLNEKFIDITKKIIFAKKYDNLAKKIIDNLEIANELVNLVHLRIDKDCEDNIKRLFSDLHYIEYINNYRRCITDNCHHDRKIVLLLEDVEHPLVIELVDKFNVVFITKKMVDDAYRAEYDEDFSGREMYALIDLLIGKNLKVDTYIGAEGGSFTSSFSVLLKYMGEKNKIIMI